MGSSPGLFDAVALVLTNKAAVKRARVGAGIEPDEGVTDLAALPPLLGPGGHGLRPRLTARSRRLGKEAGADVSQRRPGPRKSCCFRPVWRRSPTPSRRSRDWISPDRGR